MDDGPDNSHVMKVSLGAIKKCCSSIFWLVVELGLECVLASMVKRVGRFWSLMMDKK